METIVRGNAIIDSNELKQNLTPAVAQPESAEMLTLELPETNPETIQKLGTLKDTRSIYSNILQSEPPLPTIDDNRIHQLEQLSNLNTVVDFLADERVLRDGGFHATSAINAMIGLYQKISNDHNTKYSGQLSSLINKGLGNFFKTINNKNININDLSFFTTVALRNLSHQLKTPTISIENQEYINNKKKFEIIGEENAFNITNAIITGELFNQKAQGGYKKVSDFEIYKNLNLLIEDKSKNFSKGKSVYLETMDLLTECLNHRMILRDNGLHLARLSIAFNEYFNKYNNTPENTTEENQLLNNHFESFYSKLDKLLKLDPNFKCDIITLDAVYQMAPKTIIAGNKFLDDKYILPNNNTPEENHLSWNSNVRYNIILAAKKYIDENEINSFLDPLNRYNLDGESFWDLVKFFSFLFRFPEKLVLTNTTKTFRFFRQSLLKNTGSMNFHFSNINKTCKTLLTTLKIQMENIVRKQENLGFSRETNAQISASMSQLNSMIKFQLSNNSRQP